MFETLSERLTGIFDKLTGRGALSPSNSLEQITKTTWEKYLGE